MRKSIWSVTGILAALLVAQIVWAENVRVSIGQPLTAVLGIVVEVQKDAGALTLEHGDGSRSHLQASPRLLTDLQLGDPVQAVVEGTIVRTLGPLGESRLLTLR